LFEKVEKVVAVVQKVIHDGKHGSYAIATTEEFEGSITFSLEPTVWLESEEPEAGEFVLLSDLRKKRAGWRAKKGRYVSPSDEQTETRKEQDAMEQITAFLGRLRSKWFPSEEDKTWKQWVDFKKRETRDLVELLTSEVRDSFKARALFLLLAPDKKLNSIYWNEELGRYYRNIEFLKSLSPEMAQYAAALIKHFLSWIEKVGDEEYRRAHRELSYGILELLSLLPEGEAEALFDIFSFNDFGSPWSSIDDASGYNPLRVLLSHENVDDKWKWKAHSKMQLIIQDEIEGKKAPRAEWEHALKCYAYIITVQLHGKLDYGISLFADQILFLISEKHYRFHLIPNWHISTILKLLSANKYKEFRRRLVRFVILGNGEKFSVYSSETQEAAEMMLAELGESEPELQKKLRLIIQQGAEKAAEKRKHKEETQQAAQDILAQMR
jgi:hypothetical protein